MAHYVLFLHASPLMDRISPEEMQSVIMRYKAWGESVREKGHMRGGNKLQDGTGRLMRKSDSGVKVTDGPFAEGKEVVGGYYLIEAESFDQAVSIANDCPHLDFGTIEVRQLEIMTQ